MKLLLLGSTLPLRVSNISSQMYIEMITEIMNLNIVAVYLVFMRLLVEIFLLWSRKLGKLSVLYLLVIKF